MGANIIRQVQQHHQRNYVQLYNSIFPHQHDRCFPLQWFLVLFPTTSEIGFTIHVLMLFCFSFLLLLLCPKWTPRLLFCFASFQWAPIYRKHSSIVAVVAVCVLFSDSSEKWGSLTTPPAFETSVELSENNCGWGEQTASERQFISLNGWDWEVWFLFIHPQLIM